MKRNISKTLNHYKTLNEWSALGFKIRKHAKSHKRNKAGVPLFHKDQVREYNPLGCKKKHSDKRHYTDYDYDTDPYFGYEIH